MQHGVVRVRVMARLAPHHLEILYIHKETAKILSCSVLKLQMRKIKKINMETIYCISLSEGKVSN
jgi:hypothetical protein